VTRVVDPANAFRSILGNERQIGEILVADTRSKVTREAARESLPEERRAEFDQLVTEVGEWSLYYYGSKFVSYAILAELIRSGWTKHC
jgi:hypothetical protein